MPEAPRLSRKDILRLPVYWMQNSVGKASTARSTWWGTYLEPHHLRVLVARPEHLLAMKCASNAASKALTLQTVPAGTDRVKPNELEPAGPGAPQPFHCMPVLPVSRISVRSSSACAAIAI